MQIQTATAMVQEGLRLGQMDQMEAAITLYEQVAQRFDDSTVPQIQAQVVTALCNKGMSLGQLNRHRDAITVYEQVVKRFSKLTDLTCQQQVAQALVKKGGRLTHLNRIKDAITTYDQVVKRYGEATDPDLQELVATALYNKGMGLGELNRGREEMAVYEQVIERFGQASDPLLQERVADAHGNLGFLELCHAKQLWAKGKEDSAQTVLLKARAQATAALERSPDRPTDLGNLGYIVFLLGDFGQARIYLTQAITLGGETIRQDELQDSKIHTIPQDQAFRDLVQSIRVPPQEPSA